MQNKQIGPWFYTGVLIGISLGLILIICDRPKAGVYFIIGVCLAAPSFALELRERVEAKSYRFSVARYYFLIDSLLQRSIPLARVQFYWVRPVIHYGIVQVFFYLLGTTEYPWFMVLGGVFLLIWQFLRYRSKVF